MEETDMHILVVDDHSLVLKALKDILISDFPKAVVCEAISGTDAIELSSRYRFDTIILDLGLPDVSGLDIISDLRRYNPAAHIIINTMHDEIWLVKQLLAQDVDGILFKSVDSSLVAEAVRKVMTGEKFYCEGVEHMMSSCMQSSDNVTPRELDVLNLISKGMSNSEISKTLCISVNTVDTHRRHLMEKLNAKNAADLVMTGISKGLIPVRR